MVIILCLRTTWTEPGHILHAGHIVPLHSLMCFGHFVHNGHIVPSIQSTELGQIVHAGHLMYLYTY